ncbi:MAG: glycoside hydrolase family 3 C-terminal domain-containing protein [Frankia sp.]|nr:glycoside hydrolase family 3 C-terminal domain-containing protein [Frankia sp.]
MKDVAVTVDVTAELWRDPSAAPRDRVRDLIGRMTPAEKIAQLYGVWVGADAAGGDVAPHQHEFATLPASWDKLIENGLGQLTRPFGTAPVDPVAGARSVAYTQRQIMAANRFGIPAMVHEECLTGLAAWRATVYPSPLCWGASFDAALVRRMAERIGASMRRLGIHQGLAPVLDVARDLRWGRIEETIGEDPYLVGTIGAAYVAGLESAGVVATLKHFVGYSASRAGRNHAPVSVGPRELADVLLPPFEMALRAGARSVMNAYTATDGLPAAADEGLLTGLLRDTYGFAGTVVADYFAVTFLMTAQGVADGPATAAELALRAGVDVELPTVACFGTPLLEQAERLEPLIDRALERVLLQKCELGLLDPDWAPEPADGPIDLDEHESRRIARELAERSVVLLANQGGTLPLRPGLRLAVVGPRADDQTAVMGCYSFPLHVGAHHPEVPLGIDVTTVLQALRADPAGYQVGYAEGVGVLDGDDAGIAQAVEVAAAADVCVAVLGDRAGLFGRGTSGEGCDAPDLRLPGRQAELLEAVLATGTPVVLVLLVGRPYELSQFVDRLAAVVCAFFPGEEGGPVIADVLSGRVNPSGHLPVSFPATGSSQPATYLGQRLDQRSEVSSVDPTPLFPFGHGLSYAPATWREVVADRQDWPTDGELTISVTLANEAEIPTSEVVQVYLHDPVAEVSRPVRQLIAAVRVDLAPGETRTARITLPADLASYTGRDLRRIVEPGAVELRVGASSTDIRATVFATLAGPRRVVGPDRAMQPTVTW